MCWEPLKTHMEKNQMFPLSKEKLKSMRFFRNYAKKKSLIGKLTHVNVNERLTCDQILDLLKSEKWPNEINTMIQQNKKVPRLQSKQFEKMLTSKTGEEINAMVAFTSTAVGASESRIVCQRTQLDQKYYLLFSVRFSNCTEPEIFDCRCSYRTTATILTI
jgi:hypothetical protein